MKVKDRQLVLVRERCKIMNPGKPLLKVETPEPRGYVATRSKGSLHTVLALVLGELMLRLRVC